LRRPAWPAPGRSDQSAGFARSAVDRCLDLRDRLLASPRFQRWASAFPLTRPIARRRSRDLFDICAGFVYAQILYACVRLRLFEILRAGPLTTTELSARLALSPDATTRLLRAAVSLRLVSARGQDRYGLGSLGAAVAGNPGIAAMVEHHGLLYADLEDPVALLRGEQGPTRLETYWPYARAERPADVASASVADYSRLMTVSQALIADDILDAYDLERHRLLLDVGGGEGTFLAAAGQRAPKLRMMLFDLPAVAGRANERFANTAVAGRVTTVGGDFLSDPLPPGADIVSLIRVLHDHDDESALALLRSIRATLPDDGVLLIAEPVSGTRGAEPIGDAYFGFYLLAMGAGRPRTAREISAMLGAAGFTKIDWRRTRRPLLVSLVTARP